MDNVTLGYTLPRHGALRSTRVFATLQNAFTATGYSGVDPTTNINGIDNNLYPLSRTFVGGLSVNF
jgi:iron complex outermembrane receptor protein